MAGERPKQTVVYGCAGASNTGQLANAAAVRMTQRGTGRMGLVQVLDDGHGLAHDAFAVA